VTGWKTLYVNENFTKEIVGLEKLFSDSLLGNLNRTVAEAYEYQVRWKWTANAVAIWDNRVTLHTGIFDYCKLRSISRIQWEEKNLTLTNRSPSPTWFKGCSTGGEALF
jgi:alpha-ketoglutarate-dependent taurine dioxygenase